MLEQLLAVVTPRHERDDRFTGVNMHPEGYRVYGGQVQFFHPGRAPGGDHHAAVPYPRQADAVTLRTMNL